MRILLDTNVLIAAFLARGLCHELVEHCEREHQLITSDPLLEEFRSKLEQKFRLPSDKAAEVVALIRGHSEVVEPRALDRPVCRDPDDDWVLATALAGGCDFIVTGDQDPLELMTFRDTPILDPRAFWTREGTGRPPA